MSNSVRSGAFIVWTLAFSGACAAPLPVEQQMRSAEHFFNCPREQITLAPVAGDTRIARGCGQEAWFSCIKVIDAGRWDNRCFKMQDLKKRALFEMNCNEPDTYRAAALDDAGHVVGVTACKARASYQYVRTGPTSLDWVIVTEKKQ